MNEQNTQKVVVSHKPSDFWPEKLHARIKKINNKNLDYNFSVKNNHYYKVYDYYIITWLDFLPCFIGLFISWIKTNYTYGAIRNSTVFNKELYKYFRKKIIWINLFYFLLGPVIAFLIVFFAPLAAVESPVFFEAWNNFFNFLNQGNNQAAVDELSSKILTPFYTNENALLIYLLLIFYNVFNLGTVVSYFSFNKRNDNYVKLIFLTHKLHVKLNLYLKQ